MSEYSFYDTPLRQVTLRNLYANIKNAILTTVGNPRSVTKGALMCFSSKPQI